MLNEVAQKITIPKNEEYSIPHLSLGLVTVLNENQLTNNNTVQ